MNYVRVHEFLRIMWIVNLWGIEQDLCDEIVIWWIELDIVWIELLMKRIILMMEDEYNDDVI